MVLPVIITGSLVAGGVMGYGMYHLGEALALPAAAKEAPPKTALSVTVGGATAGATYSAQRRLLNQRFAHLLTYEVPAQVAHWGFRDFLRVTGPFIGTRVVMVSTSVAVMGFVATKIDVLRAKKIIRNSAFNSSNPTVEIHYYTYEKRAYPDGRHAPHETMSKASEEFLAPPHSRALTPCVRPSAMRLALSSLLLAAAASTAHAEEAAAAPVAVSPFRAASERLQQEYDRFELDELHYALLSGPRAVRADAVVRDREKILQRVKDDVPDTVPADVQCDRVTHCDSNKVCAIVCKPGSVVVDEWLQKTLRLQRKVAYRRNFCNAQLPGSHNSAINIADGYGVEDHVFEGYLKYLSWFKSGLHVHTNDQLFSLTDQMQMGVRFIEIDVHWFDGDLRIAHCGGFRSELLDGFISALNEVAKLIGTDIQWDSETIGCKPSLSSIPSSEQRPLNAALEELAAWLHAPENKDEFLMVFFDDETNLLKWKKVQTLLKYLKDHFSMDEILLPSDLVHGQGWPTFQELLDVGKRVVFMSGSDYSPDGDELLFVKDDICGWLEPTLPFQPFPTCRFQHSNIGPLDENRTIFRPQTSEIEYGFLNANGKIGTNKYLLNELSLPPMVDCGVNLPSPDNITPKRMESTVWVLKRGEVLEKGKCVGITREKPTWHSVDCGAPSMVAGCVHEAHPNRWSLGQEPMEEAKSVASCQSLLASKEMVYSAPASGYENKLVHELLMNAPVSVAGVWVDIKQLVNEVYASSKDTEAQEVQEESEAKGALTPIQKETAVLSIK